ncbi:tyrosine-type recombinase/integrase [Desulfosporosinus sp. OT]|uniref:tyrosine-type recombinase/integrase n=1 Tax=Desulfosporosinus sp. OT TaxID=913865 RepID=UPI001FA7EA52|nr:tyrosine-type recombinase/integrase [Desulfosporosinus sp. OT]
MKSYRYLLHRFQKWVVGTTGEPFTPKLLSKMLIEDYKQSMREKAPAYITKNLVVIKMFTLWAYDKQFMDHDPSQTIKFPEQVDSGPKWLNPSERKKLINYLSRGDVDSRIVLFVVLSLSAGLRAEEVTEIKNDHIKLMATKGTLEVFGKGDKRRIIPLNKNVIEAIRSYWQDYPERRNGYLLANRRKGTKLTTRAIQFIMQDLQRILRFEEPLTYHRLRHTCFKKMADDGYAHDIVVFCKDK